MLVLVVWPFTHGHLDLLHRQVDRSGRELGRAGNFAQVVSSPRFGRALQNSLIFTVVAIALKFVLGMAMALVLNQAFFGRNFLRAYFLVPWVLPGFVAYMIWRWFLDPLQGVLNYALTRSRADHLPARIPEQPDLGAAVGDRGARLAQLPVLRGGVPGRPPEHPVRAVRGGSRGRRQRLAEVPASSRSRACGT